MSFIINSRTSGFISKLIINSNDNFAAEKILKYAQENAPKPIKELALKKILNALNLTLEESLEVWEKKLRITHDIALLAAAMEGNNQLIELLLKNTSVLINKVDDLGNTPLILSATNTKALNSLKLLIKNGACLETVNNDGQSALSTACKVKNLQAVELLVFSGASFSYLQKKNQPIDIQQAIKNGSLRRKSRDDENKPYILSKL